METLLMSLVLAASPVVSSPMDPGVVAFHGSYEIRSVTVLGADVERGLVGLKVVTTAKAYDETDSSSERTERLKPENCRYVGMNKTPFDGVELALLRSGAKAAESWVVYAARHQGGRYVTYMGPACTPREVSKERLAQAKAAFAKAKLPMDKAVQFTATPDAKGQLSLKLGDRTVELRTTEQDEDCGGEDSSARFKAASCSGGFEAVRVVTVLADDKPVLETWATYEKAYAGSGTYEVLGAFVSGTKVMLLQQFTTESGMKGPSMTSTVISVSPVLDLAP
jgi:hypothetical protein